VRPLEELLLEATDPSLPVILMVSGGKDSTALLRTLSEISGRFIYTPEVIHFNHSLREESSLDEGFVRDLSAKYGFIFRSFLLDVKSYAREHSYSIEEAARILRYEKLGSYVQNKTPSGVIYTAHTSDDQAETLLLRILSGTGRTGLQGIRKEIALPGGWTIKRPFIRVTSAEILRYLKDAGQEYITDKSNSDIKFRRNFVRRKLFPVMREINPSVAGNMTDLADILSLEEEYLSSEANKEFEKIKKIREKGCFRIEIEGIIRYNQWLRRRLLRIASPVELDYSKILVIEELMFSYSTRGALDIGEGWRLRIEYGWLIFEKITEKEPDYSISAEPGVSIRIPGSGRTVTLSLADSGKSDFADKKIEYFDAEQIALEDIHIRSRRDGDRITPYGMNGSKKIKDLFIDMKIPRKERDRAVIIESGGVILWAAPFRRGAAAPITDKTRKALEIKVADNG